MVLTTHYMDEAQELADTVTVIAAGRVVASGPPDTLGGRDRGETTVRFALPEGVSVADLPLPAGLDADLRGGVVEFHIPEPTVVLHTLTEWAMQRGEVLSGLAVNRPSLEDVYLALTGEAGNTRETGAADTTGAAGDIGPEGFEP